MNKVYPAHLQRLARACVEPWSLHLSLRLPAGTDAVAHGFQKHTNSCAHSYREIHAHSQGHFAVSYKGSCVIIVCLTLLKTSDSFTSLWVSRLFYFNLWFPAFFFLFNWFNVKTYRKNILVNTLVVLTSKMSFFILFHTMIFL